MDSNSKHIQQQYSGFLNTPLLWNGNAILGLTQLELPVANPSSFNCIIPDNLRLGKRVERFVSHWLSRYDSIELVAENIQIQDEKLTLGELDCILKLNSLPIHLEVVYKFFVYDPSIGETELDHWIGPNRKDNLVKKLKKLRDKQLPLLYSKHCEPYLCAHNLSAEDLSQYVLFKAQLFVPYQSEIPSSNLLNNACIVGFYLRLNALKDFKQCKFYIPTKINWLVAVQTQVNWLDFDLFIETLEPILNQKTSPLCWIKRPNGVLEKCFVVWW